MHANKDVCSTCGNPVEVRESLCPYCGHVERVYLTPTHMSTVDVGHANMTSREALVTLENALDEAQAQSVRVLLIIHGYGSTGYRGVIRRAVRAACRTWQLEGRIRFWLPGERLRPGAELAAVLRQDVPEVVKGPHWNAENPGITVVRM